MSEGNCHDCGGYDIEWMHICTKHKGCEYCRGCECPYCAEEYDDDGLDYLYNDEDYKPD